jgi:phosphoglycolate phosphatase-like HAD superfamily hydrolase
MTSSSRLSTNGIAYVFKGSQPTPSVGLGPTSNSEWTGRITEEERPFCENRDMSIARSGLVVWDVDGTLIPADLRWLRRAIARTYRLPETAVVFPVAKVHGYTDDSIVIDTAVYSGVPSDVAEAGVSRFHEEMAVVMEEGHEELMRDQPPYPGVIDTLAALHTAGFRQTVLTGNLRLAAEIKLGVNGLDRHLDLSIGGFGSDARNRFDLPAIIAQRFANSQGHPLEADQTVVIGDAPNDIACARHAGFHVIVVTHRLKRQELEEHSPDLILDRLEPDAVVAAVTELVGNGDTRRPS